MRYITKKFIPPELIARQPEFSAGEAVQKERIKKRGMALTLGFAGGVCLITASTIHRNLLLTVAPAAAGLLGCSAVLWVKCKNGRGTEQVPPAFLVQVPSGNKTHHDTSAGMPEVRLEMPGDRSAKKE